MSASFSRRVPEELIDLSQPRRCHIVGIGGPGMSPIAKLLVARGHQVTGSDMRNSDVIDQLRSLGVAISLAHDAALVNGVDVVTYSTAIPDSNVELIAARAQGIPVRHRSGMLSSLCATSQAIGVAGAHGKTTTTALLARMLEEAALDPSVIVGAEVSGYGVGARAGASDILVLEADESDGTLDVLPLHALLLTNIDVDHLDYFGSFENLQQSFVDVARRIDGPIVLNADDTHSAPVRDALSGYSEVSTFGFDESATVRLLVVQSSPRGLSMKLTVRNEEISCEVPLRGEHNALNCAAAIAMAMAFGVDPRVCVAAIKDFGGVARRFTERGLFNGALLIDDYAHLPAEIVATISTARNHPMRTGRTIAVFQPNRFHRIAAMAGAYADSFMVADHIVITDVYASGTPRIEGVTGRMVSDAISLAHPELDVVYAPTRDDIVNDLREYLAAGDVCVSMGCGDIETLPDELMST